MLLLGAVVAHCDEKFQIVRVVVDEQGEHLERGGVLFPQQLLEHRDQVGTAAVLPLPDIVTVHGLCLLPAPVGHIPEAYSVLLQEF